MLPATVIFALLAASPASAYSFERSIENTFAGHLVRRDSDDFANSTLWPAPAANGGKAWTKAFAKAKATVAQLTPEELFNLTVGLDGRCVGNTAPVPRFNIPEFCFGDGPAGVRDVEGVSQFPAELTTAATWDRDLMYRRNKAMGQEFYDQGVHIPLAPVSGGPLGRSPLEGRAWEGGFTDPYACGEAAYQYVTAFVDSGVASVAKHWILYEQELNRNPHGLQTKNASWPGGTQLPVSSNIDDKPMHEVYMWAFAEAVRAGTTHVMCSYNQINNTHSCSNAKSLNGLLKTELNFQGAIMSDWGGHWDTFPSMYNGMDMSMPGSQLDSLLGDFWADCVELINNGTVAEDIVREKVVRILTPYYHLGQDVNPLPDFIYNTIGPPYVNDTAGYRNVRKSGTADLIKEIGMSSVTLLKNTGGLPLKTPQRVAVLGDDATDNIYGANSCGATNSACLITNLNGTLTIGFGAGSAYSPYIVTPFDALKQRAIQDNTEVYGMFADSNSTTAVAAIQTMLPLSDVTIVFVNRWFGRGMDAPSLDLTGDADYLVEQAVSYSSNVVVVIHATGVVNIEKWADNPNVTAIVAAYLPGQESGAGLVPILYGDVSPSGKIPWTWGKSLDDYPPNGIVTDMVYSPQSNFTEGSFIDYRWFDKYNITPRYEFGYGLSYTTFKYSQLSISKKSSKDSTSIMDTAEPFVGYDGSNSLYDVLFTASAKITNTGDYTASEVAQLYISIPEDGQPVRVLRGFDKVKDIKPGASATASFAIRRKDVSAWSTVDQHWYVPNGTFTISVGASSRNLLLNTTWTP
ncbi:beta-D-xylosidase/beta-D-glucosidase [Lentinula aciculospora]|uniref:Probable beta-glucosidase G n=1 Tax=Lentinula aciculospora TaxID=153920 RepID=A0A9W9ADC9_9AGAR|nr:beta-D-xylosidase/beta-D-glucosidase [Lentinula aciculospora]